MCVEFAAMKKIEDKARALFESKTNTASMIDAGSICYLIGNE